MDNQRLNIRLPSAATIPSAKSDREWPDDAEAILELGKPSLSENFWTLKDAFEGTQIFGSTGSGKSSGSGKAIAIAFLESNLGGLVLTAKTDERLTWESYAREAGREQDLIIFGADQKWRFNFLRYERSRTGKGAGNTENLVNLFCTVLETADRKGGSSGGDTYWQRALKQLLRNAIDLSVIAADDVNLPSLYRIITSAPNSLTEAASPEWQEDSVCYGLIKVAETKADKVGRKNDLEVTRDYWLKEFPNLAVETRTATVSMFTSMADCFLRGMLRELFCTELNFSPEDCFEGKIILLDLPVKEFHELGQFAQGLFKYVWQRAVERRVPPGTKREDAQDKIRPVFLWADESQFFANQYDALFQSTARSSRVCTVYLTQNLPGYQTALGGPDGRAAAESFLGNLQTKIFHANGDPQTNNWAADSIGRVRQLQLYGGMSDAASQPKGSSQNAGGSMNFEYVIQPQEFTTLRTGGDDNNALVDAIIFQGGRRWLADNKGKSAVQNYIRHTFSQR